ncbi:probable leucine-rich repeat receptor-like protein kinase At1g68400 [Eucalyptus grandis]|uniref:probable leucine-rich repeat receptor-like protein kinase At1g68400 n=1 Tax=Eucalyptus grandis TaxID=71139 RepID=UPI00192EC72A|nr:probable leucine-rich repeat receptor-like protein kinase At1g68400 [Eucalyptus grandis]
MPRIRRPRHFPSISSPAFPRKSRREKERENREMSAARFLLFAALASSLLFPVAVSDSPDSAALLAFKSWADASGSLAGWANSSDPCGGSWLGVTCNARTRRVTKLVLENLNLSGYVEPLARLAELRVLSLKRNRFAASFSVDLSSWPNLKQLHLSYNGFSGDFPAGVPNLRRLRRLDLSHNNFTGVIPLAELARLPRLLTLRLEANSFTGTLGAAVDSFPSLSDANFSDNELAGRIPTSLWRFPATAFSGNKGLCGKPLPSVCSNHTAAIDTVQPEAIAPKQKRLDHRTVLSIVAVDAVAVSAALATVTWCCYRKRSRRVRSESPCEVKTGAQKQTYGIHGGGVGGGDGGELVVFDGCRGFDRVDDLLRSSAELLGKGGVGTTYKVVVADGGTVVVKRVREVLRRRRKDVDARLKEIGGLRHPNVVSLRAFYHSQDELLLVYDYLPRGSMHSLLHENRGPGRTPLDWTARIKLAAGAASGLAYLHEYSNAKLVHGHVTSSNIIVDDSGSACISNIGLHQLLPSPLPSDNTYTAPELILHNNHGSTQRKYTQKCDVYSFGVVVLEILTGKMATGEGETSLVKWVQRVPQEEWKREVFDFELMGYKEMEEDMTALLQVALLCLATLPRDRPKMSVVHNMIEDIRNKGAGEDPTNCSVNNLSSDSSPSRSESTSTALAADL